MNLLRLSSHIAVISCVLNTLALVVPVSALTAQQPAQAPVVMLSDLHFDPLHDPDKVARLQKAPLSEWTSILESPASPNQPARFAALQDECSGKAGIDTPYALLQSSLSAAKASSHSAAFVTVSGDLLVHDLDCRYRAAIGMPSSQADDQSASAAFAEKTTVFVMSRVESTFPDIPVYLALGNNDSRCNHNRLDTQDEYLKASTSTVIAGLRGISVADKALAARTYASAGYYALTMPAPMMNTRLIVIDDIYMMPKFANCEANAGDKKGEQEQVTWLQQQLTEARTAHQRVWLLGHLPPIVNADASLSGKNSSCPTLKVVRYQDNEDLANVVAANASTITLGIFGHTHMDEFFLLPSTTGGVPVKVVSSVSPVSGNLPSFTVATVNPASAQLADYAVYKASNATGEATVWSKEYAFDSTYNATAFTPKSLADVIATLQADTSGTGKESRAYQEHFLKGAGGKKLSPSWPGYACSLNHPTAEAFTACACASR